MIYSKEKHGFTLVELLIVVIILGVLATIVVVGYNGVSQRAVKSAAAVDLDGIAKQMEVYRLKNGSFPPIAGGAATTPELETILKGSNLYDITRPAANPPAKTFVFCSNATNTDYIVIAVHPVIYVQGGVTNSKIIGTPLVYRSSSINGTKTYTSDDTSWLRGQNLCTSVGGSAYSGANSFRWSHDIPVNATPV